MRSRSQLSLAVATVLALAGCRNTDLVSLPLTPDGGLAIAPQVAIRAPASDSGTGLRPFFSIDASSLVGVGEVWLTCGTTLLATWSAPPYQGAVDLSPCEGGLAAVSDGGGTGYDVSLVGHARGTNGVETMFPSDGSSFILHVDATTPHLRAQVPPRVLPLQPLSFVLIAAEPLGANPVVRLGDVVAQVQAVDAGTYQVDVTAPGLGADLIPVGQTPPLSALEDTEELIGLTVDATATNGNTSRLTVPLRLSRVLWELPVNGQLNPALPPSTAINAPRVTDAGLVIPIDGRPTVVTPDGRLIPSDVFDHPPQIWAIAPSGRTFYSPDAGSDRGAFDPVLQKFLTSTFASNLQVDSVIGDAVCVTQSGGNASPGALNCYELTTGAQTTYPLPAANGTNFGALPGEVSSGSSWFAPDYNLSSNGAFAFLTLAPDGGIVSNSGYQNDTGTSCAYSTQAGSAVGDGTFLFTFADTCASTFRCWWIGSDATTLGSYFAPANDSQPRNIPDTVLTQTPDRRLLTLAAQGPSAAFRLWPPDGGVAPDVETSFPGSFTFTGSPGSFTGVGAGTLDVLLMSNVGSFSVAQFEAPLTPHYLYRYPHPTVSPSDVGLYSGPTGPLYVVDSRNGWIVALER